MAKATLHAEKAANLLHDLVHRRYPEDTDWLTAKEIVEEIIAAVRVEVRRELKASIRKDPKTKKANMP